MNNLISRSIERAELAKSESDFSYFFNLLVTGELITKLVVIYTVSSLKQDKDRHKYKVLHDLVRASGIGEWSKAVDELLTGTASQYLPDEFRIFQSEITKKTTKGEWQYDAVYHMQHAIKLIGIDIEINESKRDLKTWFKVFAEIRNKTRGHGATTNKTASDCALLISKSIKLILDNLSLLKVPCSYIKKNISGKYRVSSICSINEKMESLKKKSENHYDEGVYIFIGKLIKLHLIKSDPDISDFYISNGGFTSKRFEMLSYITDDKIQEPSDEYNAPKGQLPSSESEGLGELMVLGNCFSNVPDLKHGYIERKDMEVELYDLLTNDRHLVVTLLGRGGIGKTSLALQVIPELYKTNRFDAIVWFSSRDIDLTFNGAKLVTSDVMTSKDIAKYYFQLTKSKNEIESKNNDVITYFQSQLTKSDAGATLFIFDNFETIDNPIDTYRWVDTFVRHPNKLLITTRLRDFKGDYPLQVNGMSFDESMKLIDLIESEIKTVISPSDREKIYSISAGHPYIIKILIGGFHDRKMKGSLSKIIAGSDEVLTALFERTYSVLTPCAQRVFLTLASWNSAVPRLGIESILMNSLDDSLEVEESINTLIQYSLAEEKKANDGNYFLQLPYVTHAFGSKKIKTSPMQFEIKKDSSLIMKFGACDITDKNLSFERNFIKFISFMDMVDFNKNSRALERMCISFNQGWFILSKWLLELNNLNATHKACDYIKRYLENETSSKSKYNGWYISLSIHEKLDKPYEQILALTNIADYEEIDIDELSNITNRINNLFKKNEFILDENVKSLLLSRLFNIVWIRRNEADANACSRFAWLALHLNDEERARELTDLGLKQDPSNSYCTKLQIKIKQDNN